ncbi:MAG: SixA phosphatase family protein [Nostocoides sp.]
MTSADQDRTLILLRHSKAEDGGWGNDHDRQLSRQGRLDSQEAGAWLRINGMVVDRLLCSTAVRARQTAAGTCALGPAGPPTNFLDAIYNASASGLLSVVRGAADDAQVVMLIGHAPGIPNLVALLADGAGRAEAHERMRQGFPTTGMAVLTCTGPWSQLAWGGAELQELVVPRG